MKNAQYLKPTLTNPVGNQIGAIRHDPFPGTGQASFTARRWMSGKVIDTGENCLDKICSSFWILDGNVRGFVIQIL